MSVLAGIVERTREDLARRMRERPLRDFRDGIATSDRDFVSALLGSQRALIAEFKPRSPSRGALRPRDEVELFARLYDGRASAMSVLCDRVHFDGGHDLLARARSVCGLPLLCKDFLVDPYQVHEARDAGADAVLLMAAVLDDQQISEMSKLASSLGMAALVEAHDRAELDRVLALDTQLVGVNARNLHDLTIDHDRLHALVASIGPGRVVVAESGVETGADLRGLPPRADAVLVGSAFMTAADPAAKLEELGW